METQLKIDIHPFSESPKNRKKSNSSFDLSSILSHSHSNVRQELSPDKLQMIGVKYNFYSSQSRFNDSEITVKCQSNF